mmetsp:Transcript_8434/g.26753  ORF Transcript_8434/g.26753 Transcript_8434/m.26753 type:complete len:256 (-) Transcript_8434:509-1276(-)
MRKAALGCGHGGGAVCCANLQQQLQQQLQLEKDTERREDTEEESKVPAAELARLRCPVCGQHGEVCCSACQGVFYCGEAHLKRDWPEHRAACRCLRKQAKIKAKERQRAREREREAALGRTKPGSSKSKAKKKAKASNSVESAAVFELEAEFGRHNPTQIVRKGGRVLIHFYLSYLNRAPISDSGRQFGAPPVAVIAGAGRLLPILDKALVGMHRGHTAKFCLQPDPTDPAWATWRGPLNPDHALLLTVSIMEVL